jgi:uncharacterized protein with GYD domain
MHFAVRLTYTSQAIQSMMASPDDREAVARKMAENIGARIVAWFASPPSEGSEGGWKSLVIYDVPDADTHFALLSVAQASGGFSSIRTQRLLTNAQFMNALRKASDIKGFTSPAKGAR